MGFKFDEKLLVNNNIFKYEEKLNSQYTRFLESTPTYVTYYNINTIETTVDLGFSNVEKIIGKGSPMKYSEIKNLPVYGMEAIQLNIDEADEGLTGSYDNGELIILPDTITPYPDDFFILEHKGYEFLFRVTSVDNDTIKSNNFYKITFTIKYVTAEESEKILKQVTDKYTCVVENIGTQDRCIIEDDYLELLNRMQDLYNLISERYKMFFYRQKYNAFVFIDPLCTSIGLYDRYVNMFIQKHGLLYDKTTHRTIYLNNEDQSCCFALEYDNSIYRAYELRRTKRIPVTKFKVTDIVYMYSVFKYYRANVKSVRFTGGTKEYLPPSLIKAIATGEIPSVSDNGGKVMTNITDPTYLIDDYTFDEADNIIVNYMHDKIESIYNINFDSLDDFTYFLPTWTNYVKIPMLLYAMKGYYKLFIQKQTNN